MTLTRREDRVDFVHTGIDGTLRALIVGYQCRIDRAWPTLNMRHDLLGIPELWHRLRMDKGGHLDTGNPGDTQSIDHFYFQICGDELWLNLEAIACPNLTHSDILCHALSLGGVCGCMLAVCAKAAMRSLPSSTCLQSRARLPM